MNSNFLQQCVTRPVLAVCMLTLTACGGGSGSQTTDDGSNLPSPVAETIVDDVLVPAPDGQTPSSEVDLALLPVISIDGRQFSDTNVLINLHGTVEAAEGAEIASTLWTQVAGPTVDIANPAKLNNYIIAPDVSSTTLIEFRLTALDNLGRINSASMSVIVQPQPAFVRVAGTIVEESASEAVFSIRLNAASAEPVDVFYSTQSQTAQAEMDFVPVSGNLVFEPGEIERLVPVSLLPNGNIGMDRIFNLRVTLVQGAEVASNFGSALIQASGERMAQSIAFAEPGPFAVNAGDTFINGLSSEASGSGSGSLTFTSSDSTVAKVDEEGRVIGVSPGSVTISATKEGDENYYPATDSYPLTVLAPSSIGVTALVGTTDTLVNFNGEVGSWQFIRSTDPMCDLANALECESAQSDILVSSTAQDSVLTLGTMGYYWLNINGLYSNALDITANTDASTIGAPPARYEHRMLTFNNALWLIGGTLTNSDESGARYRDVWQSTDGIMWQQVTDDISAAGSSVPIDYGINKAIVYNDTFWVIDDNDGTIYRSQDGINWENAGPPPFGIRRNHQLVNFQDRLILIGETIDPDGSPMTESWLYNEVDGWTPASDLPPFSPGNSARLIVYKEQLWFIGYLTENNELSNPTGIWTSADGINWEPVTNSDTAFGNRFGHQLTVFNDRLWLIGGQDSEMQSDGTTQVWSTADGLSWTLENPAAEIPTRDEFQLVAFNDRLWLHGGINWQVDSPTLNDTWMSEDGINWRRVYRNHFTFQGSDSIQTN